MATLIVCWVTASYGWILMQVYGMVENGQGPTRQIMVDRPVNVLSASSCQVVSNCFSDYKKYSK